MRWVAVGANVLVLAGATSFFAAVSARAAHAIERVAPSGDVAAARWPEIAPRCSAGFRIAVDVGHTREATGALSARGAHEYDFNLALATKVVTSLRKGGYDNVAMIVADGAGRTQLMQRVLRANEMRADLLLSIHHDDVQPRYYKKWSFEGRSYHYSDLYSGYSLFVSKQNEAFAASFSFARDLAKEMLSRGLAFSLHHAEQIPGEGRELLDKDLGVYRYDDLFVLKHINAPSVLLETGVLVNRDEELRLRSGAHQDAVSAAVVAAVNHFCGGSR